MYNKYIGTWRDIWVFEHGSYVFVVFYTRTVSGGRVSCEVLWKMFYPYKFCSNSMCSSVSIIVEHRKCRMDYVDFAFAFTGIHMDKLSRSVSRASFAAGTDIDGTEGADADLNKTIYTATLEANGGWMKVSLGQITWTSDLTSDSGVNRGPYGDLRDTWIGENVGSVGFAYTWEAVQASELPETGGNSNPNA